MTYEIHADFLIKQANRLNNLCTRFKFTFLRSGDYMMILVQWFPYGMIFNVGNVEFGLDKVRFCNFGGSNIKEFDSLRELCKYLDRTPISLIVDRCRICLDRKGKFYVRAKDFGKWHLDKVCKQCWPKWAEQLKGAEK